MDRSYRPYRRHSAERYAELCAGEPTRHDPRPLPAPPPEHFQRLAEDKRREAASILRHVRKSDLGPGPAFARKRAEGLYREAEQYDELAERMVGGGQ